LQFLPFVKCVVPASAEICIIKFIIIMNTQSTSSLSGKRVILLGASSGIGLATAKAAAAEGANVIIVSSNQQRIDNALTELPAGSKGYAVDLSKEENIQAFF